MVVARSLGQEKKEIIREFQIYKMKISRDLIFSFTAMEIYLLLLMPTFKIRLR